jgi:hypothetical protein
MKRLLLLLIFLPLLAFADHPDDGCTGNPHHCDNTGPPGPAGPPGTDGVDGVDGVDGESIVGPQGLQGLTGVVPTLWRTETINWYQEIRDVAAAQGAMYVPLPQDQKSRLTVTGSRVANTTGFGVGYAYVMDNDRNSALTIAVGRAGSETAVQGSFGFEFGGTRRMEVPQMVPTPAAEPPQPSPEPVGYMSIPEEEYNNLLLAQVQQEEIDEQQEFAEYRYVQQESRIDALQAELDKREVHLAEIERIKREQAELQKVEAERAAIRASIHEKLRKKAEAKKDE